VTETSRIDELRRRLQKEPASIAFAQLAEEYRRAGRFGEAVDTCRAGLKHHPEYLSARVTLGRSLIETGDLDGALAELEGVLRQAPQNLAAIRGLAEIHRQRGDLTAALDHYRAAFELAQNDPAIDEIIRGLRRELATKVLPPPPSPPAVSGAHAATDQAPGRDPDRVRQHRVITVLESWLAVVLDDRRSRLYGAP
jgi:tetratricopeptide (TPR) repeat protein